jgi:hypothetical protein
LKTWSFHQGFGTTVELTPILEGFETETKLVAQFQVVILTKTKFGI